MNLLVRIINVLIHVVDQPYLLSLYAALFTVAYHGSLRIGELSLSVEEAHVAKLDELLMARVRDLDYFLLRLTSFKHSNGRTPVLKLAARPSPVCPVYWLTHFLSFRGPSGNTLFQLPYGKTVTQDQVMHVLRQALQFLGLNPDEYGTHSFRIGRCTDLTMAGYTDAQLRQIGRWRSDAFCLYIRPDIIEC